MKKAKITKQTEKFYNQLSKALNVWKQIAMFTPYVAAYGSTGGNLETEHVSNRVDFWHNCQR